MQPRELYGIVGREIQVGALPPGEKGEAAEFIRRGGGESSGRNVGGVERNAIHAVKMNWGKAGTRKGLYISLFKEPILRERWRKGGDRGEEGLLLQIERGEKDKGHTHLSHVEGITAQRSLQGRKKTRHWASW